MDILTSSALAQQIKKGFYRHYKGNLYELVCIGRNTETLEEVVIYRSIKDKEEIWVRPLKLFNEQVIPNVIIKEARQNKV